MLKMLSALALTVALAPLAHADDGKEAATKLVKEVVQLIKDKGADAAIAAVNKGQFTQGELYPTIFNFDGKCLAHGSKPARAGQNLINDKDPDGKLFVKERMEMAKKGPGWQQYKFQNAVTKKIEPKDSYFEPVGDVVVSAGAYAKK